MSDQDDKVSFKIDLDAKESTEKLLSFKEQITKLGESKSIEDLISGFLDLAAPIAAAGVALFAFKKAFDLALEGSELQKVQDQFDALATSAGVNAETIRSGIEKATGGYIDMDDAIKDATKSVAELGENAQHIPELFDRARTTALALGKDAVTTFDDFSRAVASGQTRLLRQYGIIIDQDKVMRNYAVSIGTTVGALSQQGKQQAILNALLDQTSTKFSAVKQNQESLSSTWTHFKVTLEDVGQGVALAFNKMFGPAFSKALEYFDGLLEITSNRLKASFGSGAEQASAKVKVLTGDLEDLQQQLDTQTRNSSGLYNGQIEAIKQIIAQKKNELDIVKAQQEEELRKRPVSKSETDASNRSVDNEKLLKQQSAFQKDLLSLTESRIKSEEAIETDATKMRTLALEDRKTVEEQYEARIADIKNKAALGTDITKRQADELIVQAELEKKAKIESLVREEEDQVLKSYDNRLKAAQYTSDGISAAFAREAAQAKDKLKDQGLYGQTIFSALANNASNAFKAMGDGSKSGADIMKGFMFGAIADIADAQGQLHLANGIASFNGVEIAEGGALIALASVLRSQGGGGSSVPASGGGGAAPAGGGTLGAAPAVNDRDKKSVTIQVQGNYFETDQTKQRLLEMIRETTDATDYKYQQIGVR